MRLENLNPPGIVRPAVNLEEELAQKIKNREKRMIDNALEHARLQGADLLQIKQRLGKRKFKPWVERNCPFSRETAYRYIHVAEKWDDICQRGLQIESFHRVIKALSRKVKKPTETSASPETGTPTNEPDNNRQDDKSQTESAAGEPNDATPESTAGVVQGPDQENAIAEPDSQPEAHHDAAKGNRAQKERETGKKTPKKERSRPRRKKKGSGTSNATNVFEVYVMHPRIAAHLQSLFQTLLDFHRKGHGLSEKLVPRALSALARDEDRQVQVLLTSMQQRINSCRDFEEWLDKTTRKAREASFPEWPI